MATAWKCQECDEVSEEALDDRLYECGECGEKFLKSNGGGRGGNLCPNCGNKPSSRIDTSGKICPACEQGEMEEVEVIECYFCSETFAEEDEYKEHLGNDHCAEIVEDWLASQ